MKPVSAESKEARVALTCDSALDLMGNSPERARMMRSLGAQVIMVPQVDGGPGQVTGADIAAAAERAKDLAHEKGAYYVDQFNNPGTLRAHEETTGPEIWRALAGRLD